MIYFLIVVSVGGTSSITGPLLAALLLGIADVAGKYFIPKMGAFTVYLLMILILMWRPQGLFTRKGGQVMDFQQSLLHKARWRPWEFVAWGAGLRAAGACCPRMRCLINEIAIVALFAMSLDLILGYTGIVSLGHAAFFGFGAYAAALFAKLVMPDPTVGLVVAVAALRRARCAGEHHDPARQRPHAADGDARHRAAAARTRQQARLADRRRRRPAGRGDGAGARPLRVRSLRPHGGLVFAGRDARAVPPDAAPGAFALRRHAQGDPRQPPARDGDRHSGRLAHRGDLHRGGRAWPARRVRCWRRPPASPRSTCWPSTARPTCC